MATNLEIINEIISERVRQDQKWGEEHDDQEPLENFTKYIKAYATWAWMMLSMQSFHKTRHRLVQVAALAVAAIEQIDKRHPVEEENGR